VKDKIKDLMSSLEKENKITSLSKKESIRVEKKIRKEMESYKIKYNEKQNKSQAIASKIFLS